ncbi:conserved protein of unknown function (plasmid) [Cupriavidus taiwanensis]|uniref:Uncharacterized protein n=1 Tax=Cupriavidus taiwanensis TaxID=164546 RepID=A0A375IT17_9BURK|nr:conserved hypothetical protein [Cupriavidus taiwanensis]SPA31867.1 conserved hypothetical protein [Cupriavidus taiwanensis]SPK76375.1 conserved protein of unknown function [Cupriavidus taiwanensis]
MRGCGARFARTAKRRPAPARGRRRHACAATPLAQRVAVTQPIGPAPLHSDRQALRTVSESRVAQAFAALGTLVALA